MSKPKILVFAPREEPPETIAALEGIGCELVFGNRDWPVASAVAIVFLVLLVGPIALYQHYNTKQLEAKEPV